MMTKSDIAVQVAKDRSEEQIRIELYHLDHKIPLSVDEVESIENRIEILRMALRIKKNR